MLKEMAVKCNCGLVFDLVKAPWCNHPNPSSRMATKMCPKGHCICHRLHRKEQWRVATPEEQNYGFNKMLKEDYGGVKE